MAKSFRNSFRLDSEPGFPVNWRQWSR
jgi:hypothetical protein